MSNNMQFGWCWSINIDNGHSISLRLCPSGQSDWVW
jgi:hypothetical protein